jgi:nucleoside-diphosphate-sugar epimerase
MKGCKVVIHMASPFFISGIKDAQKELIEPALRGTRNVLNTANKTETVERVVLTSSVVAIYGDNADIHHTQNSYFTEEYWNRSSSSKHQPYPYSKTIAEQEAWRIQQNQYRWDLVVINPGMVLGPSLSKRTDSTSISFMQSLLTGEFKQGVPKLHFGVVDVRDVADAHVKAAMKNEAKGRNILVSDSMAAIDIVGILRKKYNDQHPLPKKTLPNFLMYVFGPFQGFSWKYINRNIGIPLKFDNSKSIENLGIQYRNVEETIIDHAEQLIEDNIVKRK